MVLAVIVGTGDMAYALAHLFRNNNSGSSGNYLEITKPGIERNGVFHETGVPLVPMEEAFRRADIVFLTIPAKSLKFFVPNKILHLKDKILIDCTNGSKAGEDLNSLLKNTGILWAKAFNDIEAVDVVLSKPGANNRIVTKMCSPDKNVVHVLSSFATRSLGLEVKVIPYERYNMVTKSHSWMSHEWACAVTAMLLTFAITELYAVWINYVETGHAWCHLPVYVTNKAICWTAITGFAFAQLPGILSRMFNMTRRGNLRDRPRWLKWSLSIQKHLVLLSLWFLFAHIVMSVILMSPAYFPDVFESAESAAATSSKMNSMAETSIVCAILGASFYTILGVCSLPSVASQMTSKQWQFVHGPLAWSALAFAILHVLGLGLKRWLSPDEWPGGMLPISLLAVIIPVHVIALKGMEVCMTFFYECCSQEHNYGEINENYIQDLLEVNNKLQNGSDESETGESSSHDNVDDEERNGQTVVRELDVPTYKIGDNKFESELLSV